MSILSWRSRTVNDIGAAPAVPLDAPGSGRGRRKYAVRRHVADTPVTRRLAAGVHVRRDRAAELRRRLMEAGERMAGHRGPAPRSSGPSPETGERIAAWAIAHVLRSPLRPVPSYGFGLATILTHCVAARRQQRLRVLALWAAFGLMSLWHPRALVVWLIVVLVTQLLTGGGAMGLLRRGAGSVVVTALLAVLVVWAWVVARSHSGFLHDTVIEALHTAGWLAVLLTVVHLADRVAALGYTQSLRPARKTVAQRPRGAPYAASRIAAIEEMETWQTIPYVREGSISHFLGAGRDAWFPGAVRLQLTAAGPDDRNGRARDPDDEEYDADSEEHRASHGPHGYRTFEADDLLDRVRDELLALSGNLTETHALPNCDVAEMYVTPAYLWRDLRNPRGGGWPEPEAEAMCLNGRSSPSSAHSRRYLSAQVVSWGGHVVVTVFVHAALEGRTLHFVTRPHIIAPPFFQAAGRVRRGRRLALQIAKLPVDCVADTVALAARAYRATGHALRTLPPAREHQAPAAQPPRPDQPLSLRERYAMRTVTDMHQEEDVRRHVSILQKWMFNAVEEFLEEHGVAVAGFVRQVAIIQNNTLVYGDSNLVNIAAATATAVTADDATERLPGAGRV
ncbi:hypothetical protein ABZ721_21130 [Streptomyces sp. NPDC006733]|uniref:hypothetical protein n=1 Tax=Streptomyces sp. NPDC006733 TaxID=3155460 RepID=UPI0033F7C275